MGEAFVAPAEGGTPEADIVRDMARRALWVAPALVLGAFLIWGPSGAASTAYGIGLVLVNFALAAALNTWAARVSVSLLMASALFGYLIRLALIFLAFWLVRDAAWMNVVAFGITVVVTHLGLLAWEMRYVSASLAYPGLKPTPVPSPSEAAASASKES